MIFLYAAYADDTTFFLKSLDSVKKCFRNAESILYGIGTTS